MNRVWPPGRTQQERLAQWRADHPEQARQIERLGKRMRRWLAAHPEAVAALEQAYGTGCRRCGRPEDLVWDHVIPLPRGANDLSNLQRLCRSCNSAKRLTSEDWRPDLGAKARAIQDRFQMPPEARAWNRRGASPA